MVEAEEMQDGGVNVGDVMSISQGMITQLIGRAVDVAAFEARAREPDSETVGMMIAAIDTAGAEFETRGAAELGAEDDERFVEQAALFEVLDQTGDR